MSDELTDLLRAAAGTLGGDVQADPAGVIARARRTRRRHRLAGLSVGLSVLLVGATSLVSTRDGKGERLDVASGGAAAFPAGWTQLPDPPLSPRAGATAATIGNEIIVAGGTQRFCRPIGSCPGGLDPWLADGAAFNLRSRTWRAIAPAPFGFAEARALVIDGAMVLSACGQAICDSGRSRVRASALLRYQPATDVWDELPSPPIDGSYLLAKLGRDLVAYIPSDAPDRADRRPDWRLDQARGTWSILPDDPLPPVSGRQMVADGDDLLLFGTEVRSPAGDTAKNPVVGARLDAATGAWTGLPPSPSTGPFWASRLDGLALVLHPQPDLVAGGGTFDPATGRWSALQPSPTGASLAGVMGATNADYGAESLAARGWVLELATRTWIELPLLDARSGTTSTSFGRRLFHFGGVTSPGAPSGKVLGDAWVWTPPGGAAPVPPVGAVAEPSVPPTEATVRLIEPTAVPTIAQPQVPASSMPEAPPPPGAPNFVSAFGTVGDAAVAGNGGLGGGRVSVRFSQPVDPGVSPATSCCPAGYLSAMSLIVYGADRTCSTPAGNAHAYLAGRGTDTITTDATSLVVGTTYISIGTQFVRDAATGVENAPVVCVGIPVKT